MIKIRQLKITRKKPAVEFSLNLQEVIAFYDNIYSNLSIAVGRLSSGIVSIEKLLIQNEHKVTDKLLLIEQLEDSISYFDRILRSEFYDFTIAYEKTSQILRNVRKKIETLKNDHSNREVALTRDIETDVFRLAKELDEYMRRKIRSLKTLSGKHKDKTTNLWADFDIDHSYSDAEFNIIISEENKFYFDLNNIIELSKIIKPRIKKGVIDYLELGKWKEYYKEIQEDFYTLTFDFNSITVEEFYGRIMSIKRRLSILKRGASKECNYLLDSSQSKQLFDDRLNDFLKKTDMVKKEVSIGVSKFNNQDLPEATNYVLRNLAHVKVAEFVNNPTYHIGNIPEDKKINMEQQPEIPFVSMVRYGGKYKKLAKALLKKKVIPEILNSHFISDKNYERAKNLNFYQNKTVPLKKAVSISIPELDIFPCDKVKSLEENYLDQKVTFHPFSYQLPATEGKSGPIITVSVMVKELSNTN